MANFSLLSQLSKWQVLVIVLSLGGILYFSGRADEEEIRRLLQETQSHAQIEKRLTGIEAADKATKLVSSMAESVHFEMKFKGHDKFVSIGRRELKEKVLLGFSQLSYLETSIKTTSVHVKDSGATVDAELSILGALPGEKGKFLEMHKIRIELGQESGDWLIERVAHIENLRE